jgi:hypothetical protein
MQHLQEEETLHWPFLPALPQSLFFGAIITLLDKRLQGAD